MTVKLDLGSVTIHRIVEQEAPLFLVSDFFPTLTKEMLDENRSWLEPRYFTGDGKVVLCVQSYIVKTPHHTIMIDSCVGNHKHRPARPFWHMMKSDQYEKNLAAAGFGVGDIDYVMCTHLHVDHVGWNTRLENGRWVPTFPKAKMYSLSESSNSGRRKRRRMPPTGLPMWRHFMVDAQAVLPIVVAIANDIAQHKAANAAAAPLKANRPIRRTSGTPARHQGTSRKVLSQLPTRQWPQKRPTRQMV